MDPAVVLRQMGGSVSTGRLPWTWGVHQGDTTCTSSSVKDDEGVDSNRTEVSGLCFGFGGVGQCIVLNLAAALQMWLC